MQFGSLDPHAHGTADRCALCGGRFGLVRYYSWRAALCSKNCRDRYRTRRLEQFGWLRRMRAA